MPLSFDVPYQPPHLGDSWCWMPKIPDRIDARRRRVLEALLAKAGTKAKIDEFFRSTAELGAGNDEHAALQEFGRLVKRRKEEMAFLAKPVPRTRPWPLLPPGSDDDTPPSIGGKTPRR